MIEPKGTSASTNTTLSASSSSSSVPTSRSLSSSKQASLRESGEQLDNDNTSKGSSDCNDKETLAVPSSSIIEQVGAFSDNVKRNTSVDTNLSIADNNNTISIDQGTVYCEKIGKEVLNKKRRKKEGASRWSVGETVVVAAVAVAAKNEQMRSRCIESSSTLPQSLSEQKFQLERRQKELKQPPSQLILDKELRDSTPEVLKEFQSGNNRLLTIKKAATATAAAAAVAAKQHNKTSVYREFVTWSEECGGTSGGKEQHLSDSHLDSKLINQTSKNSQILSSNNRDKLKGDLELDWLSSSVSVSSGSSILKRAFNFLPNSTSSHIRTNLVESIKAGKSNFQKITLNKKIKNLVDQFRSPAHQINTDTSVIISENQQPTSSKTLLADIDEGVRDGDDDDHSVRLISHLNEDETRAKSKFLLFKSSLSNNTTSNIHGSISYQSLSGQKNHSLACEQTTSKIQVLETKRETCSLKGNGLAEYTLNNNQETTKLESYITIKTASKAVKQTNIINNMTSEGCVSKSKYIIEDKIKKQQQQANNATTSSNNPKLEDRRSTYCSSLGGATSDINFDSSFSSVNNCSESNNTFAMIRQYSRDFSKDKQENFANDCRIPSGEDDNDGDGDDDPNQDSQNEINRKKNKPVKVDEKYKKRENWDKNIEFLLAVIGFAVDLGNVWRFPYICYKNGGGAFLIPYTIMFILGGLPIFYLEMSLGQYFSSGCLTVWKRVCPMAKGIGYAMCVLNFFTGLYYNTIISWAVFFFVESFTNILPWTSCNNSWNSNNCRTIDQRQTLKQLNSTAYLQITPQLDQTITNQTMSTAIINQQQEIEQQRQQQVYFSSPTKDYFEREVLQIHLSTGIDDLGYIRKPLAIYLAIVFVCIYFAIWKGVKSTGKAVWITALLPYFVLIPLLIRGVFLEGAWLGIRYYLYPQWVKIIDVNVWVEAAKQIYFSLGPGFGTLMALSSYNKFNHNCCRDTLIAASVNYFASFISGLVIFAVLGYMATIENVDISDVATEGPGLVFQVYPEGLATMRFSSMWSVLFFIMVITLGIDSTFGGLESVITGLCDEYPRLLRAHRGVFIGFLIVLIYLCSLPTTTYGGNYVIYLLESYGTSLSLLFIVLIETIIVCWLYGAERFCKNLEEMYGERPGAYWRICWKYISPTILLIIFVAACLQELDKYHTLTNGDYTYPSWAPTVGLLMTGSSVCCIPIYALYYLKTKTSGSFIKRLKIASKPIEGNFRDDKGIGLV